MSHCDRSKCFSEKILSGDRDDRKKEDSVKLKAFVKDCDLLQDKNATCLVNGRRLKRFNRVKRLLEDFFCHRQLGVLMIGETS